VGVPLEVVGGLVVVEVVPQTGETPRLFVLVEMPG
jgi:hypothetical protein